MKQLRFAVPFLFALLLLSAASSRAADTYDIDPVHSFHAEAHTSELQRETARPFILHTL